MEVKNIAIVGDSWAWGEWNFIGETNFPTHNGMQHYLQLEYPRANIVNFARAGGSNLYQIDYIEKHIGIDKFKDSFDIVVCFWTDPGRDILNKIEGTADLSYYTEDLYISQCNETAEQFLIQLDNLQLPVFLIGGQVSLPNADMLSKCSNLIVTVDRMVNLVDKAFWNDDINGPVKGKMDNTIDWMAPDRLSHLNFNEKFKDRLKVLQYEQNLYPLNHKFFPDNGHAGRSLHRLASLKVIEQIGKLNGS